MESSSCFLISLFCFVLYTTIHQANGTFENGFGVFKHLNCYIKMKTLEILIVLYLDKLLHENKLVVDPRNRTRIRYSKECRQRHQKSEAVSEPQSRRIRAKLPHSEARDSFTKWRFRPSWTGGGVGRPQPMRISRKQDYKSIIFYKLFQLPKEQH